jgi:hypothetical protein
LGVLQLRGPTFNGGLVELGRAADEGDAVVIGVDAHEHHAAGHHRRRIAVAHLQPEHLRVEAHGGLQIGDVQHDVAELSELERLHMRTTLVVEVAP